MRNDAHLHAPYLMQCAVTLERQLPDNTTLAVTYTNSHGLHELRSDRHQRAAARDLSGESAVYPLGNSNPLLLMTSSGLYNQNQLITNINSAPESKRFAVRFLHAEQGDEQYGRAGDVSFESLFASRRIWAVVERHPEQGVYRGLHQHAVEFANQPVREFELRGAVRYYFRVRTSMGRRCSTRGRGLRTILRRRG